jgi:hypothetical protein
MPFININALAISVILSEAKDPVQAGSATDSSRYSSRDPEHSVMNDHEYFVYIMSSPPARSTSA